MVMVMVWLPSGRRCGIAHLVQNREMAMGIGPLLQGAIGQVGGLLLVYHRSATRSDASRRSVINPTIHSVVRPLHFGNQLGGFPPSWLGWANPYPTDRRRRTETTKPGKPN